MGHEWNMAVGKKAGCCFFGEFDVPSPATKILWDMYFFLI